MKESTTNDHDRRPVGTHFDGDLRRKLLDAAIVTIDVEGVDQLSLRAVARRVGVSHAAPAHHFGDKAGLLTAIAVEGFERLAGALSTGDCETRLSGVGGPDAPLDADPVGQLGSLARAYLSFASQFPAHFEVMFRPALVRPDVPELIAAGDVAFDLLRSHVARAQQAGWLPDESTDALTIAAWAMAHGLSVLRTQGSLGRHASDTSIVGMDAVIASVLHSGR
jgi:AcrR family transcriptional regulator